MNKIITDTLVRLLSSSPKYFKILQVVAVVTGLITGIPALLSSYGIVIPASATIYVTNTVSICAFISAFLFKLPINPEDQHKLEVK